VVFLRVVVAPRAKLEAASVGGLVIAALSRFQSFPHSPNQVAADRRLQVLDTDPGARREPHPRDTSLRLDQGDALAFCDRMAGGLKVPKRCENEEHRWPRGSPTSCGRSTIFVALVEASEPKPSKHGPYKKKAA
jgi:hypothetical protein